MVRKLFIAFGVLAGLMAGGVAVAQQAPPFETKKVADNVYVFRYQGHQSNTGPGGIRR